MLLDDYLMVIYHHHQSKHYEDHQFHLHHKMLR